MQWSRHITGLTFSFVFVVTYFTNKVSVDVFQETRSSLKKQILSIGPGTS